MSIKKILGIFIFIGIIVFIIYLQYEHNTRKNQDIMIKRHNKRYIKELSCTPKKPIDKGIIYAQIMKQYWNSQLERLWVEYEEKNVPLSGAEGLYRSNRVKNICGLEEDIFGKHFYTKNYCFPHVINKNGEIKTYNPNMDDYIYKPKNYNQDVDFTVEMKYSGLFFKEDCCKLLDYNEMITEVNHIKKIDNIHIFQYEYRIERLGTALLSKIYFLRVIENGGNYRDNGYIQYNYYPVSLCGKVPYYFDK
ncbi:MAG: hypothetical protein IJ187_06830 [Neisseriaceae bacterium]|nr:hypothetical protein [Neisseriaceae bacterium]